MAVTEYPRHSRLTRLLEEKPSARVLNFALIPILLILALLLPPISLVQRIADTGTTSVTQAGGIVGDPQETYVEFPTGAVSKPFRAALSSIPRLDFLEGSAGGDLKTASRDIPSDLLMAKSPFYQLKLRGDAPDRSTWVIPIPNDSEPYETLDVYTWEGKSWQWLPHTIIREDDRIESEVKAVPQSAMIFQTNPKPALIGADLTLASALPTEGRGALAQVQPVGLFLGSGGALDGTLDANFDRLGSTYAVVPVIRNYDGPIVRSDLLANMLVDPAQRSAHINKLVDLAVGNLYQGIEIDYRGLDSNLRGEFNQFIKELADKLHASKSTLALSVRVEAPVQVAEDRWDTGAYDWVTLGMLADTVKVPAPVDPRAYVSGGQLDSLLNFAVGQINRYKLQLVLSGRSVEQSGNYLLQKSYSDALQPLIGRIKADQTVVEPGKPLNLALVSGRPNSGLVYDPNLGTYVYRYQDDQGNARTVWLENSASLSHKLDLIKLFNIQGFTLENLPADGLDTDLWPLLRDYQQGRARTIDSNFTVQWTVKGSGGQQISQARPLSDPNVVIAAPLEPGTLQVEAAVLDRGQVLHRESASDVAVATFTPTPTPTPLYTPTPQATPTPEFAELTVTGGGTINVRSGPSTSYPKIGEVSTGGTYRVTGKSADDTWYQFNYNDAKGWISSQFAALSGSTAAVAVAEVAPPPPAAPQAPAAASVSYAAAVGQFGYGLQIPNYNVSGFSAQIVAAGFNWVKFQIPWKDVEGSSGNPDWGNVDGKVNPANAAGLKVLLSIPKAPAWARPGNANLGVEGPPADPGTYARFVGQLAGRYCGKVNAIEVWNEQNLSYEWGNQNLNAADYVRLLAAAYSAIKGACPQTTVVSGALTPTGAPPPAAVDDFTYLEQMYQAGLKNVSDAIGAHPSGFNVSPDVGGGQAACDFIRSQGSQFTGPCNSPHHSWSFRATMEGYRNIMAQYGDGGKQIWPTEFGWASGWMGKAGYEYANDNTAQEEADWTVRAYQIMKGWGWVGPAFLWNLGYTDPDGGQWNINGRPAYAALKAMAK